MGPTIVQVSMELSLFEQVGDAVRSLSPEELGHVHFRAHRRGIKVWVTAPSDSIGRGAEGRSPREHYEAQLIGRQHVDGQSGTAIEVGFHAEHRDVAENTAVIDAITATESTWRQILGDEAEIAPFYGAENWRRVSEAWIDPDLDDPELAIEMASRLVDYLEAIEPARR